jgi:hypothetical protein
MIEWVPGRRTRSCCCVAKSSPGVLCGPSLARPKAAPGLDRMQATSSRPRCLTPASASLVPYPTAETPRGDSPPCGKSFFRRIISFCSRCSGPSVCDPPAQGRMTAQDLRVPFQTEGPSPRPPFQPLLPGLADARVELPQTAVVRWAAVVLVVAAKFRIEDSLLLVHGVVPMCAAPFRHGLEGPSEALLYRLDMNSELPSRRPSAHLCVRPRKSKVPGFVPPGSLSPGLHARTPRVFSGWRVSPYLANLLGSTCKRKPAVPRRRRP